MTILEYCTARIARQSLDLLESGQIPTGLAATLARNAIHAALRYIGDEPEANARLGIYVERFRAALAQIPARRGLLKARGAIA